MKKAIYPGSFDPITMGHIDIVRRLSAVFSELTVLISESPEKKYLFSTEERKAMIEQSFKGLGNIKVDVHTGLTIEYMKKNKIEVMVRGLRAVVDFEYEMGMASLNKKLAPELETLLVFASPEYYYVSSRAVKEVAKYGGKLDGLVPAHVMAPLTARLR
ncbi:MAG: pantetheine-phosphate adenylyltransferase [Pseudobdellovibrionaceae bacterium]